MRKEARSKGEGFITLAYMLRRLGSMVLVLWVIASLTFILMHTIPGNPFMGEKVLPPAVMKNLMAAYHLDQPLWQQYLGYMWSLLHLNLGWSISSIGRTVNQIIATSFPVSAIEGCLAVLFSLIIGIPAGIIAALFQGRAPDYIAMFIAVLGVSVPSFIVATLLQYFVAYRWGLLPAAMWGSPAQVIMPVLSLAGLPAAFFARLMRSSMLEVLSQDYVRTARSKGLSNTAVVLRHALRNSLTPVVSYMGPLLAAILTGSFIVETIFAVPGLGRYFVNSIYNRDYPLIMGVTIFYSALLVTLNFLVDLAYAFLDPRVKVE